MALLVARLLPAASRALTGPTRGPVAARPVPRRPPGRAAARRRTRASSCWSSPSGWPASPSPAGRWPATTGPTVARTVVGAEQVVPAPCARRQGPGRPGPPGRPGRAAGRWPSRARAALVVAERPPPARRSTPPRLAAVGFWRSDFTSAGPAELAGRLRPPAAPPVVVTGTRLVVRTQVGSLGVQGLPRAAVHLSAELRDSASLLRRIDLGPLPDGDAALTAAVPCQAGCRLSGLRVTREGFATVTGAVVVTGLAVDGRALDAGLTDAARWRPLADEGNVPTLRPVANGLSLAVATTESSDPGAAPADVPLPLPAVLTPSVGEPGGAPVQVVGLDATPLQVQPVASADALPARPGRRHPGRPRLRPAGPRTGHAPGRRPGLARRRRTRRRGAAARRRRPRGGRGAAGRRPRGAAVAAGSGARPAAVPARRDRGRGPRRLAAPS